MSTAWRKTLVYLGLVEEPEEELHEPEAEHAPASRAPAPAREPAPAPAGTARQPSNPDGASNVRALRPTEGRPAPRQLPADAHVTIIRVDRFEDAEQIGARYRIGEPVVFDLSRVESSVARRVLDFVSGVTYALRGRLSPVAKRSFLLVPEGLELPPEERERLASLGYGGEA